jgi:hypothetical protein
MTDELTGGGEVFVPATDDSMAAAIERHLNALLAKPLPPENTPEARDRRRFFAAISRGVLEHLKAHPGALQVVFTGVPAPYGTGDFEAQVQVHASDV